MPEEFVYMCSKTTMTTYAYDGWGNLVETAYSDDTPTVTVAYDALSRQVEANDAAGVTTFAYDAYGANTNETVIGVAGTNVLERYTDAYGRNAGYALNGTRQTILGYDEQTGRLATMQTPSAIDSSFGGVSSGDSSSANSALCTPHSALYYTHDGNKNVRDIVAGDGSLVAHYGNAPFGAITTLNGDVASANPWRFSSEYSDDDIDLTYYDSRHYDANDGRWGCREEFSPGSPNSYSFVNNRAGLTFDILGRYDEYTHFYLTLWLCLNAGFDKKDALALAIGAQYPDTKSWDPILNFWSPNIPLLHNLTGFEGEATRKYRCCVLQAYRKCMKEARAKAHSQESAKLTQDNKYFECGVFLHVLGDTYAHTMDGDISYQPVIGHTVDWTAPDNPQLNLDKFLRYLNDLISAFDEKKTSGMPIREVRDKLATWRYDFATKKWTIPEGAEYQQVIMDLFRGKFPNADISALDKKIKMSDGDLDNIVSTRVLPQLRKCYWGAW